MTIRIGTAGWSIPRQVAEKFPSEGTSLERYSARFPVAEINSSFHRPHRESTWQRWHDSVPADFGFSVKLPKLITHELKLERCEDAIDEFVAQSSPLGEKLAALLVQLPPKLAFDEAVAARFFELLTTRTSAKVACEPRHASWFTAKVDGMLDRLGVTRVAADPALCESASIPGGWPRFQYWRLHGSPQIYRSSYEERIDLYASVLKDQTRTVDDIWCIFDNTASSAGAVDALALMEAVSG